MSVKLEKIDELRRRANVSYEAAKEALELCNEDIVEALVYLERQNKVRVSGESESKSSFWSKVKALIRKGNNTKFIIKKRDVVFVSMPVTIAVIITMLAFHVVSIGLVIALLAGFRFSFESKSCEMTKVNQTLTKVYDSIDVAKRKLAEDTTNN
jgi:acyl-coenzyme A synthetase/AMP-(fatty) acid ligase